MNYFLLIGYLVPFLILAISGSVIFHTGGEGISIGAACIAMSLIPILNIVLIGLLIIEIQHASELKRRGLTREDFSKDPFEDKKQ